MDIKHNTILVMWGPSVEETLHYSVATVDL